MKKSHLNLLIPQWQGGGQDLSTYEGGQELKDNYLKGVELTEIEVGTENVSAAKNHIVAYDELLKQLTLAKTQIADVYPDTIFTIGGGCDSDIVSISYLNSAAGGDMTLLYFDAHGDLNTPESSGSKHFYGMCLRTLLGDGDGKFIDTLFSTLSPSQAVIIGVRDLDEPESEYINNQNVSTLTVDDIEADIESVIKAVKEKNHKSIYIHIDLDVLDPSEFPFVPVPVLGGLKSDTFIKLLKRLRGEFAAIGLGLLEYSPSGMADNEVIRAIVDLGVRL